MNYIDTHAHLYHEYYPEGFEETVQRAIEANVKQIILPCVSAANVAEIFAACNLFPDNLFPLIGLHPTEVKKETYINELAELKYHLDDEGIVGIGEIGMDLFWDKKTIDIQREAFETQLNWALEYNLPLSLHVRDAYAESYEMLSKYRNRGLKGVMHCFSGGIQEALWAIEFGFCLGIGGVITFRNNKLQDIVKEVGLKNIVLETDAPFLAPTPFRGKTNESAYIRYIAEKTAEIFNTTTDEVMSVTTENAIHIFTKIRLT